MELNHEPLPVISRPQVENTIQSEWKVVPLSTVIKDLKSGVSVNSATNETSSIYVLKTSAVSEGKVILGEVKPVVSKEVSRVKCPLRKNCIVISRMNTPELVGECGYSSTDEPTIFLPDRLWITEPSNKECDFLWLSYLLSSVEYKHKIKELATGTSNSMKNIAKEKFLELEISFPPIAEQKNIAAALSDVDALLSSLDALITKKRDMKKAAMQELLTGKTRLPGFSGEWIEKYLSEIGVFIKGKGISRAEANSGTIPCVRYGEIYTQHNDIVRKFYSFISHDVAQEAVLLKTGDILFTCSGETKEEIGKSVAFTVPLEAYAGGDIIILRGSSADAVFLGYRLNARDIVLQKSSAGQGDAVVHISVSSLGNICVTLPEDIREQQAIADVLSDMDAELEALEARYAKVRDIKTGMMQELLTGRTRLVPTGEQHG